jgi:hypothetical protein
MPAGTVIGTVNDNNAAATISPGGNSAAGTLTIDTLTLRWGEQRGRDARCGRRDARPTT